MLTIAQNNLALFNDYGIFNNSDGVEIRLHQSPNQIVPVGHPSVKRAMFCDGVEYSTQLQSEMKRLMGDEAGHSRYLVVILLRIAETNITFILGFRTATDDDDSLNGPVVYITSKLWEMEKIPLERVQDSEVLPIVESAQME